MNIFEMYVDNGCHFGFYVHRDSWSKEKFAKVVGIEWVEDGKMIKGEPPYFGGFKNPPGHPRAGKAMGPRSVTLEAPWFQGGVYVTSSGGTAGWTRIYPKS